MSSTIEEWFEAFTNGDFSRARELFADDSSCHVLGDGPLAGDYRGVDGLISSRGAAPRGVGRNFLL